MRNAMLVGLTVDSMRLADVFVALEVLRRQPGVDAQRIMTLGQGASGVLGLYAAILDPGVHQVMLVNPPTTHADAPIFLNILRHTDLPEATALLAPRHLSFFARVPGAFDYTRHVYSLYGKPKICSAQWTLPESSKAATITSPRPDFNRQTEGG